MLFLSRKVRLQKTSPKKGDILVERYVGIYTQTRNGKRSPSMKTLRETIVARRRGSEARLAPACVDELTKRETTVSPVMQSLLIVSA